MNRCLSCNTILTPEEKRLTYSWGEPIELCSGCLGETTISEVYQGKELEEGEEFFDDYYQEDHEL